ncbi:MAG: Mbeg1-like protein [Merdibacter sp.]
MRYREVTMGDYRNVFDEAQEIQFAAVTMRLRWRTVPVFPRHGQQHDG